MRLALPLLAATFVLVGCNRKEAAPPPAAPAAPAVEMSPNLQGKVLETIPAPPYTYLKIHTAKGDVWAGVPAADLPVGASVTVLSPILMEDFQSHTLNRTFHELYLGTLDGAPPVTAASFAPAPAAGKPAPAENVAKASGAKSHTVADLFAQQQKLKDQAITLRGKVVKYSPGILGKNWLHIQDGSGAAGTNDIAVTSHDTAAVGDVVTVNGTLHLNRDFGSGYAFAVIIEDSTISK